MSEWFTASNGTRVQVHEESEFPGPRINFMRTSGWSQITLTAEQMEALSEFFATQTARGAS